MTFPVDYASILDRLKKIEPVKYAATRNFLQGDVTYLSPYISRGVISTKQVLDHCLNSGWQWNSIEKFIQELAWRDYWQRVWQAKNIDEDLKNEQTDVLYFDLPTAILEANTGIMAIDVAIKNFYQTGYLHNHARMYIASMATNVGKTHWKIPAKWMYYHLLDGDWASNALSWQWVCGANSNKKYYANQENINRFCATNQVNTFLDITYEKLPTMSVPEALVLRSKKQFTTKLPQAPSISLENKPTALYTWYNLDPEWRKSEDMNRVVILEPSHFKKLPISDKSLAFLLDLAQNIENHQLFIGEFADLQKDFPQARFVYKEHPSNQHFSGTEDQRDWMSDVKGYYPSFFGFWKKVKKEIG